MLPVKNEKIARRDKMERENNHRIVLSVWQDEFENRRGDPAGGLQISHGRHNTFGTIREIQSFHRATIVL